MIMRQDSKESGPKVSLGPFRITLIEYGAVFVLASAEKEVLQLGKKPKIVQGSSLEQFRYEI